MRTGAIGLLLLVFAASDKAAAICTGPDVTVLLRGAVLDCRSALPEIEAELETRRHDYEERAAYYRNSPLAHVKNVTRPYDEHLQEHLRSVQGVIVTFLVDGRALIPKDAKSQSVPWEDHSERRELFLLVGGSSCDLLSDSSPTVLVDEAVCCDVIPSSQNSCMLELRQVKAPEASLLEKVR